jgi:hypothetical protein
MKLSISTTVPEYVWYIFNGQRGMTFTNAKNKRGLKTGDVYGLRQLKNGTWNLVFPEDVRSIYKVVETTINKLVIKSKTTKIKVKADNLIKPKDIQNLDTVVIKGRWDSDRFRPAITPRNEVQVKGDGEGVQGDGIDTKNYQWRVLIQNQEIPTKRGFKTLLKGTWIGLRFVKDSQGGKIVCRDGFYYNVDTANFDSLVVDSRLLPKARWPDLIISPEMVMENRRSARQDYLKQKRETDANEAAIRRAEREAEKAKQAEKKAKDAEAKAKAKAAEEELKRTQAENKVAEKHDTVKTLKTALDSATKPRKTVKKDDDYHEEELDDEPDDISDDDSEHDDSDKESKKTDEDKDSGTSKPDPASSKKPSVKAKDDKAKSKDSEDDSTDKGSDSDDSDKEEDVDDSDGNSSDTSSSDSSEDESEEEDDDSEEDDSESEDPSDDDLEDDGEKDPEATKKLSKALRGDSSDADVGDEDLGDEDIPDDDSSGDEEDASGDDSGDEDAKKAAEEDKRTKNRVSDGKSEEGEVVVFNADTRDKTKYVVLSIDQHPNHDHLLVYRLFALDSDAETVKEVRINKQRGQKLTDLCKVVKTLDEKELDALQSKTQDYEVDKKPIKS